jgi:hypothetical protein
MRYAMMMGNPSDGFFVIGPFDSREAAARYIETERSAGDCWVVELLAPSAEDS